MMKKLSALALIVAMLLCATVGLAAEAKIPDSAANLFYDGKAVVQEKCIVADPDWSSSKGEFMELAALGKLFGSTKESAAVSGNYHEWLVLQGYGNTAGRFARMSKLDPFSTNMDCVGAVVVLNSEEVDLGTISYEYTIDQILKVVETYRVTLSNSDKKVTSVAAAYDDEVIKGIIAEYKCDAFNTLICYTVIANKNNRVYLYHYNANNVLMEVTTKVNYNMVYGYTYKGKTYTSEAALNKQIAEDKANGIYSSKDTVTFGILEINPTRREWLKSSEYPTLDFTRVSPSMAELIRGIAY